MRLINFAMLVLLTIACGCAKEPFTRAPLPKLDQPEPAAIRAEFAKQLADQFTSDDTVIIHAPFRKDMAILGVLKADRSAGTFELLGLSHMGVELFHLAGERDNNIIIRSAIPPLMEQKNVLLSIGTDTRRMYFDLVPAADATTRVKSTVVRFTDRASDGNVIREFGGDPVALLEKRVNGVIGTKWRVRYYNYKSQGGLLYPRGIVMDNGKYHYRITIKNRAFEPKQEPK